MYLERISLFFFLNPSLSLSLGIYQEGISCCFCDNYAILHRQIISWKSLKVPLAYLKPKQEFVSSHVELFLQGTNYVKWKQMYVALTVGGSTKSEMRLRFSVNGILWFLSSFSQMSFNNMSRKLWLNNKTRSQWAGAHPPQVCQEQQKNDLI